MVIEKIASSQVESKKASKLTSNARSKFISRFLLGLANLAPASLREDLDSIARYADLKYKGDHVVGFFVSVTLIGLFLLLLVYVLNGAFQLYFVVLGVIAAIIFVTYMLLYFKAEHRANGANKDLPNALSVISANLRSGMTPYHAVKKAGDDDFGLLSLELKRATARSIGTKPFTDYLLDISTRIKSSQVNRSLRLFVASLRSGGKVVDLLLELSQDISERLTLKKNLMMYMTTNVMFIMFIVIVGMPGLLAISVYFLDTITAITVQNAASLSQSNIGFGGGEIVITSAFLISVSYFVIFLTGLFACFFLGAIVDGDIRKGLIYAPLLIGGPYVLFFVARFLIGVFA
jgi:Flp pilus assembly protein TadB